MLEWEVLGEEPLDESAPALTPTAFPDIIRQAEASPTGVSPVGATTPMQVMPKTALDPGFGVAPAANNSPEEVERVGVDYAKAMLDLFKSPAIAGAAYNAGPGTVVDWMRGTNTSGKNPSLKKLGDPRNGEVSEADFLRQIPFPETNAYVQKVAALAGQQQGAGGWQVVGEVPLTGNEAPVPAPSGNWEVLGEAPLQAPTNLQEDAAQRRARDLATLQDPNKALGPMLSQEGVTQNVAEFFKQLIPGAAGLLTGAAQGAAALTQEGAYIPPEYQTAMQNWGTLSPYERNKIRQKAQTDLPSDRNFVLQGMFQQLDKGKTPAEVLASPQARLRGAPPRTIKTAETPLYKEATEMQKRIQDAPWFKPAPGYEQSPGGALGQAVGSMGAGIATTIATGGAGAPAVLFTLTQAGQQVQDAIEKGASENQIMDAAAIGGIPGLTDSVPIEILLGHIPVPGIGRIKVPAGMIGNALKVVGRIGMQAFAEGFQEGGQQWLQNEVARAIYNPAQEPFEGVLPNAGAGAGAGGIAEFGKEAIELIGGRRVRRALRNAVGAPPQQPPAPPPAATAPAAPGAPPAAPPAGAATAQPPPAQPAPAAAAPPPVEQKPKGKDWVPLYDEDGATQVGWHNTDTGQKQIYNEETDEFETVEPKKTTPGALAGEAEIEAATRDRKAAESADAAVRLNKLASMLPVGTKVTTDTGEAFEVLHIVPSKLGDYFVDIRWDNGKEVNKKLSELRSVIEPYAYEDATTGERKMSAPAKLEAPSITPEAPSKGPQAPPTLTAAEQEQYAALQARMKAKLKGPPTPQAETQPPVTPEPTHEFTPEEGWDKSVFTAREAAKGMGIEWEGKKLADLTRDIHNALAMRRSLGTPEEQAERAEKAKADREQYDAYKANEEKVYDRSVDVFDSGRIDARSKGGRSYVSFNIIHDPETGRYTVPRIDHEVGGYSGGMGGSIPNKYATLDEAKAGIIDHLERSLGNRGSWPEAAQRDAAAIIQKAKDALGDVHEVATAEGTRAAPVKQPETHEDLEPARAAVEPEPTEAQKEAGNYPKGHVEMHGLGITMETPKGAERRGPLDEEGEPAWVNVNPLADYGYIKRTIGADATPGQAKGQKEKLDVYIGPNPQSTKAFVIDQHDPKTGEFDEHKAILGADSQEEALAIYDAGFSDGSGPSRRPNGGLEMSIENFKRWIKEGDTRKAILPQAAKAKEEKPSVTRGTVPTEHETLIQRYVAQLMKLHDEKGADTANAKFKEIDAKDQREVKNAFRDAMEDRRFAATAKPGERPLDDHKKPIFKKGERVVITGDQSEFAGRHGVIVERNAMTMRPVMGGGRSETSFHYIVKTDQGAETHVTTFEPETGEAPEVVPDIEIVAGRPESPQSVQRHIGYAKEAAKKARAAADRARKPQSIREHNQTAERHDRDAASHQKALDAWKEKHPEEAERIFGKPKPVGAPEAKPAAGAGVTAVTGVTVTENEAKNGIEIKFKDRPDDATLEKLKAAGFRWSKFQKLWYATRSSKTIEFAQSLQGKPAASEKSEKSEKSAEKSAEQPKPKSMLENNRNAFEGALRKEGKARYGSSLYQIIKTEMGGWQVTRDGAYIRGPFAGTPEGEQDAIRLAIDTAFPSIAKPEGPNLKQAIDPEAIQALRREYPNVKDPVINAQGLREGPREALNFLWGWDRAKSGVARGGMGAAGEATGFDAYHRMHPQEMDRREFERGIVMSGAARRNGLWRIVPDGHTNGYAIEHTPLTGRRETYAAEGNSAPWPLEYARKYAIARAFEEAAPEAAAPEKPTFPIDNVSSRRTEPVEAPFGKYKGYASTNEGGRLSVEAYGETAEAAQKAAIARLKQEFAKRQETRAPTKKGQRDWTEIGKNAIGQTLYQDQNGVRSILQHTGIRTSEPVGMVPTREGVRITTDRKANPEYALDSEPEAEIIRERDRRLAEQNSNLTAEEQERYDALQARLKGKLKGQASAGLDPEIIQIGVEMTVLNIKAGVRRFAAIARKLANDLDVSLKALRPYLRSWYYGALDEMEQSGADTAGMDDDAAIRAGLAEIDAAIKAEEDGVPGPLPPSAPGERPAGLQPTPAQRPTGRPPEGEDSGGLPAPRPAPGEGTKGQERPSEGPPGPAVGGGTGLGATPGVPNPGVRGPSAEQRPEDADVRGTNYRIEPDEIAESRGPKAKALDNLAAIRLIKKLQQEGRLKAATRAEQTVLAKYVGWGGLKGALKGSDGKYGKGFEDVGKELEDLLTDEEYRTASRSSQYAHYTAEHVIRSMWDAVRRMGFGGGSVFEPGMGIGHFLGMMPADIAEASHYQGIEMDHMTAAIATALYPKSGVRQADYTLTPIPDNTFDLVIGNPPFADTVIHADPKYAPRNFEIHDYFFAKSMDALRPGGIMAFITSAGTMNKLDDNARLYLARRAQFLGGVRLPSIAFKQNARTEVTTDILFFQKRAVPIGEDMSPGLDNENAWTSIVQRELPNAVGGTTTGNVSSYFSEHPEMVLGEEGFFDKLYPDRYAVHSREEKDEDARAALETDLAKALTALPENVYIRPDSAQMKAEQDFASNQTKDGSFYIKDGKVWQYSGGAGAQVNLRGKAATKGMVAADYERVKHLIPIRDALRDVYRADLAENEEDAKKGRKALNKAYDTFVDKFGPINKAVFEYRRPSRVQEEVARAQAHEEARARGEDFNVGEFDAGPYIAQRAVEDIEEEDPDTGEKRTVKAKGPTWAQIAKLRQGARDKAAAEGRTFIEGSFDPSEMPDVVIEKRPNVKAFMDDPESYRLRAIEDYNEQNGEAKKRRVFTESVLTRETEPDIKSAQDGVMWSLNKFGRLDLGAVAQKRGQTKEQVVAELGDAVYRIPGTIDTYQTADEYLSGDVLDKLAEAKKYAEIDQQYQRNADALEAAKPQPLPPAQIRMSFGMPWIPGNLVEDFAREIGVGEVTTKHSDALGGWTVELDRRGPEWERWNAGGELDASEVLREALNRTKPRIYRWEGYGADRVRVFDPIATQQVADKIDELTNAFAAYDKRTNELLGGWVMDNHERYQALADLYNDKMNRTVPRVFDGAFLTTPGVASDWKWRPHQRRVVARIILSGNTYVAHAVGAGKTSEYIGAGMEMRRLGMVRKPMYVVPNVMLAQFTKEFYEQYPLAKIAVADERRFHTSRRKQFIANAASEDLDAIILTHSAFGKIPLSPESIAGFIQEEIDLIDEALDDLDSEDDRITVRKLENKKEKLEQRLRGALAGRRDQTFTFEEMGVDFVFVDEAHKFRKLDFASRQSIKGIDGEGSDRAFDLYAKLRYLDSKSPGRSVVMGSGTPVTNTMGELYTLSKYMQREALQKRGIWHFDSWAASFGDVETATEPTAQGTYERVTRFRKFVNGYELYKMVSEVMDIVTSQQLEQYVVRPKIKGGERKTHLAPKTEAYERFQATLVARVEAIKQRRGPPSKGDDILLSVINDGRHAAIDMRFIEYGQPDPKSKLNMMVENVFDIWKRAKDTQFFDPASNYKKPIARGPATQMIFSNLGVNPRGAMGFSGYRWIKESLVRRGVPANEIAFIGDYKTHIARQKLFNDMNAGKIRVLVGSTEKLGMGVNAQRRLLALHNLDPLWYPADDEQRIGRGLRQGNWNPELEIHDYSTKGTYDEQMWKLMASKARFIEQFFRGDPTLRTIDDVGEASFYEQASAMAAADERIILLVEMQSDLDRLERQRAGHEREQYGYRQKITQARHDISHADEIIPNLQKDIEKRQPTYRGDDFKMTIGDETYEKFSDAADALAKHLEEVVPKLPKDVKRPLFELGGFKVLIEKYGKTGFTLSLVRTIGPEYVSTGATTGQGIIHAIQDKLSGFESRIDGQEAYKVSAKKQIAALTPLVGKKFAKEQELQELRVKVARLEHQIAPPSRPTNTVADVDRAIAMNADDYHRGIVDHDEFTRIANRLQQKKDELQGNKPLGTTDQAQTAYHGSPYDFEKFKDEAIGSGEGAASFGYGHYFAGKRAVAQYYREALSGRNSSIGWTSGDKDTVWIEIGKKGNEERFYLARDYKPSEPGSMLQVESGYRWTDDEYDAIDFRGEAEETARERKKGGDWAFDRAQKMRDDAIKDAEKIPLPEKHRGKLYQVELAPKDDEWLDWDKPLHAQSEKVKRALMSRGQEKLTGHEAYQRAALNLGGMKAASDALRAAGIPGIRYADQGSRNVAERVADAKREIPAVKKNIATIKKNIGAIESGRLGPSNQAKGAADERNYLKSQEERLAELEAQARGEQTYNYVVFDPEHIKIEAKFQMPKETGFYSALTREVETAQQNKASAGQWQAFIRNAAQRGVKEAEVQWSGVKEWIASQGDKPIAKQDLVNFLRASEPEIKEVMLKSAEREAPGEEGIAGGPMQHARYRELETRDLATSPFTPMERSLYDWLNNHPEATDLEYLTREYDIWLQENRLGQASADELRLDLMDRRHRTAPDDRATLDAQIAWLDDFGTRWEEAQGEEHFAGRDMTKFGSYQLPGGKDYREFFLTWPKTEVPLIDKVSLDDFRKRAPKLAKDFEESMFAIAGRRLNHRDLETELNNAVYGGGWGADTDETPAIEELYAVQAKQAKDQKAAMDKNWRDGHGAYQNIDNPIVRLRFNTRTTAAGKKMLFIEEMQEPHEGQRMPEFLRKIGYEVGWKWALRYAAENGFDEVGFTPGQVQADRYDLSKHVSRVHVEALPDGRYKIELFDLEGIGVRFPTAVEEKNLPDWVGKELAEKIVNDLKGRDGKPNGGKTYSGLDLKVGGEGLKRLYDKIIPAFANKYGKKWGAEVGQTKVSTIPRAEAYRIVERDGQFEVVNADGATETSFPTRAEAYKWAHFGPNDSTTVHSLPITPTMRESVMQGQPLFKRPQGWEGVETAPGEKTEPLQRIQGATLYGAPLGEPSAKEAELIANVERIIKGLAPAAEITPMRTLRIGEKQKLFGAVYQNMGQRMIAWALDAPDPIGTGRHEVVHWLRAQGYITDPEWAALEKAAKAGDWIKKHNIKARYPSLNETEQLEEAIADEFGVWRPERPRVAPPVKTVFQRIAAALQRIKAVAQRIFGPKVTYQDVFGRIEKGEVGQRVPAKKGRKAERIKAAVPPVPTTPTPTFDDPDSEQRWQDARKGVGAGQNMIDRSKEWFQTLKHSMSRHWLNLPNEPKYADLQQELYKLEAAPTAAIEKIIRGLQSIVGDMKPEDMDLFARKVVLDDLSYEVDQEHELPFGLSELDIPRELAKVDMALSRRPDLLARLAKRKAFSEKIRDALVDNGVLDKRRVQNPAYYRHQVLEYAVAVGASGGGPRKLRTPKWARRMGSTKDINANYLEAEADWLRKALVNIAEAKTIKWIKESPHNIRAQVVKAAKDSNQSLVDSALAADQQANGWMENGKMTSPLTKEWLRFRTRIAMGLKKVRIALEDGALTPPPWFEDAADAIQNNTRDDTVLPFLAWILDNNEPGSEGAATALKAIAGRKEWTKDLLGKNYADPLDIKSLVSRGLAPEGYVTWQPEEGKMLFLAKTIPEHAVQNFLAALAGKTSDQIVSELGLPANVTTNAIGVALAQELKASERDILAFGGERYTMVLPEDVAKTLNSLSNTPEAGLFDLLFRAPVRGWKRWVLLNPMRVLKYNLNNLSGDLDAIIAGAPKVLKQLPKATKELANVMVRGKEPTQEYTDAVDRGVFNAGITMQGIPDINTLAEFEHLMTTDRTALGKAMRPFSASWRFLRKYTTFRENMLRYAAYLHYLDQLNAGVPMSKIGYGASNPAMVDAVTDKKDKAALLARDLVGDYGAISHGGQELRRSVIPFWSWAEINTKRYWRLTNNAFGQGIGKGLATSGLVGASLGARTTAYLLLRMFALMVLINLWNRLVHGDDEDKLDPEQARQLHILLGHDSNGEIMSLRVQGAVSDALSWLGLGDAIGAMNEVAKGRGSLWDVVGAVAKAPVNKIVGGVTPVVSTFVTQTAGVTLYPDAFHPLPVRDKWRELFRLYSFDPVYDLVMGKPTRGLGHTAAGAIVYQRDPGEIAYDQIRGMTFDWLAKTKGEAGIGSATTARGEALREWRTAARYGDKRAARVAFEKMKALKIDRQSANRSLQAAAPLGSLSLADKREFFKTLTPQEQDRLKIADKWYQDTLIAGAQEATKMLPEGTEP